MDKVFSKVFLWMFLGLMLTFGVAYYISTKDNIVYNLFSNSRYFVIWILEIVVAIVLGARINKLSVMSARVLFLLYSFLTGITISSIFIVYSIGSIIYVFLIAAILFLVFGIIGYFTKLDITKLGSILFMALIASLICIIVNMFINNETFDLGISIVMILVFLGYVAYDINVIKKRLYYIEDENKLAIYGALQLYLDFINLFLRLLSLFGKNRD